MFLQDFQAWKLHTWQDYLYFFLMAFSCFALFYFISKGIIKRRNDTSAQKRVKKKLKVKDGKVYHNVTFDFGGRQLHFDHLLVDATGIVAMRAIGWGIRVYGSPEDATWKVEDNKTKDVRIENPIRALSSALSQCEKGWRRAVFTALQLNRWRYSPILLPRRSCIWGAIRAAYRLSSSAPGLSSGECGRREKPISLMSLR